MHVPRSSRRGLAVALASAALTVGCSGAGGDTADEAATGPDAQTDIEVADNEFRPAHFEVAVGDTVTWTWTGGNPHDVSADGFASEIQTSGTFTHTFEEPGTYDYVCTVHPDMTGAIEVVSS